MPKFEASRHSGKKDTKGHKIGAGGLPIHVADKDGDDCKICGKKM